MSQKWMTPFTVAALTLALLVILPKLASAASSEINKSFFGGVAIEGYDAVAYHTAGKPTEGKKEFEHAWKGAVWRFASAENRDLFAADPEKYAPQYGGYCAYAVAQGSTAGIDPEAWTLVDGKLYLNYNRKVQKEWESKRDDYIRRADENWPDVLH